MAFSSSIYNYFFNGVWKDFAIYKVSSLDDEQLSRIVAIAAVFNSIARLIVGFLSSKISFKTIYFVIVLMQIACSFSVNYLANNYILIVAFVSVSMFSIGAHVTLFPTITTKVFGVDAGKNTYPFIYQCFSTASVTQTLLYKLSHKNFDILLKIFGGLSCFALFLAIFFSEEVDWTNEQAEFAAEQTKKKIK